MTHRAARGHDDVDTAVTPIGAMAMFDALITLAFQHYVVFGILGLAIGVLLNLAVTAGPDIVQALHLHKLY